MTLPVIWSQAHGNDSKWEISTVSLRPKDFRHPFQQEILQWKCSWQDGLAKYFWAWIIYRWHFTVLFIKGLRV